MIKQFSDKTQLIGNNNIGITAYSVYGGGQSLIRTADRDNESAGHVAVVSSGGFNGSGFDKWRNNTEGTLLASGARTGLTASPIVTNFNAKGLLVFLNITVASGTGGLSVIIQTIDPISGNNVNLNATPTAITATGLYTYELYPGATSATSSGNGAMQQRTAGSLPRNFKVAVLHGDTTSYSYSVGYQLIV